jgi:hypothetical protein
LIREPTLAIPLTRVPYAYSRMQTDVITTCTSARFPRRDTYKCYHIYRPWAPIWCIAISTDQSVCRSLGTKRDVQRQDGRSLRIMIPCYLAGGYGRFGDTTRPIPQWKARAGAQQMGYCPPRAAVVFRARTLDSLLRDMNNSEHFHCITFAVRHVCSVS